MTQKKIKAFLIGDINIDLTLEKVREDFCFNENIGREIKLDNASLGIGGSGFNFVKIAGAVGMDINFVGKIGNDLFGNYIKNILRRRK